jgi:hypothetical protein
MPVIIVSKTRMHGDHVCVGGYDLETRQNIRLLNAQGYNQLTTTQYQIGEIWSLGYQRRTGCEPPHVEDVLVASSSRMGAEPDLAGFIRANCPVVVGPLEGAFDGCLQYTGAGSAFISRDAEIPSGSVCFWEANTPLNRDDYNDKVRYAFRQGFAGRHVSFVGFQDPADYIPQGALIRLSLARWWKPNDAPATEPDKCFLQFSGCYL